MCNLYTKLGRSLTVKNAGDTVLPVPVLILKTAQKEYTIEAQVDYIEPGETLLVGYTLPYNYRNYTKFQQIEEFALSVNGAEAELEISNLKLTGRCFGK